MVRNRVLALLTLVIVAGALILPFAAVAPNRLLSGRPISLIDAVEGWRFLLLLLPLALLLAGSFVRQARGVLAATIAAAIVLAAALVWLAGDHAAAVASTLSPAARTSLGTGFWVMWGGAMLAVAEGTRRLDLPPALRFGVGAVAFGATLTQVAGGHLDQLSIMKEYANQREVFAGAVVRHGVIVFSALAPTLLLGVPLGLLAYRRRRVAGLLFPVLNVVQTIPSIALFGLLLGPLSALGAAVPWLGVSGVGLAPAIVALALYSLLPIVRNTVEGLAGVPDDVRDAARGMGLTPAQIFRQVEMPLALPVFFSGLRIATVQAIGLAAVAALIGAGGLGSIMFQGLFANALDLVLLGTVPVILLALLADALLKLLATPRRAA